jgi:hypothetical protein
MKQSRTGHRCCSRGRTGGTQDAAVEAGEVRMGVRGRHLLPPASAGGIAAVQRPPSANTRADAGKRARWNTARHDTDTRTGEQASRKAVIPQVAEGRDSPSSLPG